MSEPLNESVPAEAVGSDPEWDAAQAEAQSEQPTAEATPAEPEPAPAAEAPAPAEPDAEFTFSTLESGVKELRLSTGEVYRGANDAEVMANLAKGKVEANRHIQQLKQPQAPAPVVSPTPVAPQIDPAAAAIADYTAQGLGFKDAAEMREMIAGFREQGSQSSRMTQELTEQREAFTFVKANPDFVNTTGNAERIDQWLSERQLGVTARNMEDAFYALKGRGLLEGKPVTATPVTPTRVNNMPPPPSGNSPLSPVGAGSKTLADLEAMTTQELEAYMDSQYAAQ